MIEAVTRVPELEENWRSTRKTRAVPTLPMGGVFRPPYPPGLEP